MTMPSRPARNMDQHGIRIGDSRSNRKGFASNGDFEGSDGANSGVNGTI
jgi:hypothetical protein